MCPLERTAYGGLQKCVSPRNTLFSKHQFGLKTCGKHLGNSDLCPSSLHLFTDLVSNVYCLKTNDKLPSPLIFLSLEKTELFFLTQEIRLPSIESLKYQRIFCNYLNGNPHLFALLSGRCGNLAFEELFSLINF